MLCNLYYVNEGETVSRELGAWLRQQREARRQTRNELAKLLVKAAENNGDHSMPDDRDSIMHSMYRWERGMVEPGDRYKFYLCEVWGIAPERFGMPEEEAPEEAPEDAKLIMVEVTVPKGLDAQVKIIHV